jgi:hypothetical protein
MVKSNNKDKNGNANNKGTVITIVGGGNSAHILIPFMSSAGHTVNLLTRRPSEWKENLLCEVTDMENNVNKIIEGSLSVKSDNPEDVITEATVIIFCMPVHAQREVLGRIGPFINKSKKDVFVGTIYGQAGFNWMVHEMEKENRLTNVTCFAVGLIPWICRTLEYGFKVANYGGKQVNICAVTPKDKFEELNELILDDMSYHPLGVGKFVQACSFLSLTLSVDNQIIHPARCYGLWKTYEGKWSSLEKVPYFYRDFDSVSAENLSKLNNDYTSIREAVKEKFPERPFTYMLPYLDLERLTHNSENIDIEKSFQNSPQLGLIKIPTKQGEHGSQVLDINCRFFTDDIPYGLLIAKWVGEQLKVDTPFIVEVIRWSQNLRGEHWLDQDGNIDMEYCLEHKLKTGIPPSYDICAIEEILD